MYDIVLVSLPYNNLETPPLALAVLKGAVENEGFSCHTYDLSLELYKNCNKNRDVWLTVQEYFVAPVNDDKIKTIINDFISYWAKTLIDQNSRYIGLSIFSFFAHTCAAMLATELKKINPAVQIILGGPGCSTPPAELVQSRYSLTGAEKIMTFGQFMKKRQLVNNVIAGDGEQALIDLLSNNLQQKDKFIQNYRKNLPYANFDDFDLFDYPGHAWRSHTSIPIFTSKGCVRNCDFCDVNVIQDRFRFRNGKNIVDEMIYLAGRYNIRNFSFSDSLINGSLKIFIEWITLLAEYNKNNPRKKITWDASWICRPIGQIPEYVYSLMKESGCSNLSVGTESGSNSVLKAMDKKTNVEAFYYELEKFRENGITVMPLMVVGHWSEQWEDFLETCNLIYKLSWYVKQNVCIAINLGATFFVNANTPADVNRHVNGLTYINGRTWWTSINPALTGKERYYRLLLLEKLCDELNVPLMENTLPYISTMLENDITQLKSFYEEKTAKVANTIVQHSEYYYNNFQEFFNLVTNTEYQENTTINISLEIETFAYNSQPVFQIKLDNQILHKRKIINETVKLNFDNITLPTNEQSQLSMTFYGKGHNATLTDCNGNIVQDTFVLLKSLIINGIDLVQDPEFFNTKLKYFKSQKEVKPEYGFWINNSELKIIFDNPFLIWYYKNSVKNKKLGIKIVQETSLPESVKLKDIEYYRNNISRLLQQLKV